MNVNFEKLIAQGAFNDNAIEDGYQYFIDNRVCALNFTQIAPGKTRLNVIANGKVNGSHGLIYDTTVIFQNDDLVSAHCTCPAFEMRGGLCKHLVALLYTVEAHYKESPRAVTPPSRRSSSANHYWTEQLLKSYQPDIYDPLAEKTGAKVNIWPQLKFEGYGQFMLTFTLGVKRPYVLKSLHQFVDRMAGGEVFRYGKDLEFAHVRENFAPESLFYLDLIMEMGAELDNLVGQSQFYIPKSQIFSRELYLSPQKFDQFFAHHLTRPLAFDWGRDKGQAELICGDVPLILAVDALADDTYRLVCDLDDYRLYESFDYGYVLHREKIYQVSRPFHRLILPILDNLRKQPIKGEIIFTAEQMAAFLALVYRPARELVRFDIAEEIVTALEPADLAAQLYFDYPQTNEVRGRVAFGYGEVTIDPLNEPPKGKQPYRERAKEYQILNILQKYHFAAKNGYYWLHGEEAIFEFLTQGLTELLPLGQIMVEDRLEKMKSKKSFHLAMDISMTKGIIEIKFDESKFAAEELIAILKAYQSGKKYILLNDNTFLDIVNPSAKLLNQMMTDFDLSAKALAKPVVKLPAYRALYLNDLLEETPEVLAEKSRPYKDMVRDILKPIDTDFMVPKTLNAQLRPYQLAGFRWLKTLAYYGFGGILADDMGLGKTIQTIALLLSEAPTAQHPSIIVAPTSLIYNWQRELDQFAPTLRYRVIAGVADGRRKLLENVAAGEILITSYDTLKRDIDCYEQLEFEFCIADEAQYIKNHYTQNAQAIKALASRVRFALTGTPMENSLADLWSIMDYVMPGYLLKWQKFKAIYEIPITRHEDEERLRQLRRQVAPFLLRRLKKDVLTELPDKIESTVYAQLSEEEEKIYHAQLALSQKEFLAELNANGLERSQIKILALLTRLRQACCSPQLFLENFTAPSSKLLLAMDIIQEKIQTGSQILLFSQFTTMLDLIAAQLKEAGIDYLLLTGATKSAQRMQMVNAFNNDHIPVFLISLKAGGVGLNLTAADTVIHFDPWWNLSAQNQATDRAHRIGQDKKVHVIKLIAKDTIEEKIEILQNKKKDLTDQIITEGQTFLTQLNRGELEDLFSLQDYA